MFHVWVKPDGGLFCDVTGLANTFVSYVIYLATFLSAIISTVYICLIEIYSCLKSPSFENVSWNHEKNVPYIIYIIHKMYEK